MILEVSRKTKLKEDKPCSDIVACLSINFLHNYQVSIISYTFLFFATHIRETMLLPFQNEKILTRCSNSKLSCLRHELETSWGCSNKVAFLTASLRHFTTSDLESKGLRLFCSMTPGFRKKKHSVSCTTILFSISMLASYQDQTSGHM